MNIPMGAMDYDYLFNVVGKRLMLKLGKTRSRASAKQLNRLAL